MQPEKSGICPRSARPQVARPIRVDAVVRELARAHGFNRTGNRITDRVMGLLADVTSTQEPVGKFLWVGEAPAEVVPFRYSMDDRDRRSLDDVAMEELLGLVKEDPTLAVTGDPALALAREIVLARLAAGAAQPLKAPALKLIQLLSQDT